MSDLRQQLRDADPVAHEPGLSAEEVRVMRRRILGASPGQSAAPWLRLVIAVAVVAVIAIALRSRMLAPLKEPGLGLAATEKRQVLFETPGGTRIIWVLNPNIKL